MTVSLGAENCRPVARIGSEARPDDSDESSSRATVPTVAGGAPRFATSSFFGRPGWNRSPRRPPAAALHKKIPRGARKARRLTLHSVSSPAPSEPAFSAPRRLFPDSTIRRDSINACPNSQRQPYEIPTPGVDRARCARDRPRPCSDAGVAGPGPEDAAGRVTGYGANSDKTER